MTDAGEMRRNAERCLEFAEDAASQPAKTRYMRMAAAWEDLAENQDWLDGALRRSPPIQPRFETAA
jgi:hypothetical protein